MCVCVPNYIYLHIHACMHGVVLVHVQAGTSNWVSMGHSYGAIWDTSKVPKGALRFRIAVIGGYDPRFYFTGIVLPRDWKTGAVYDTGVQITDIAQESCRSCDYSNWK